MTDQTPKTLWCSRCKRDRPIAEFGRNRGDPRGYSRYCKECAREYQRKYNRETRSKVNKERRAQRRALEPNRGHAGTVHKRDQPKSAPKRDAERPSLPAIEPLFHTYAAPKPDDAFFDEDEADRVVDWIESNLRHYQGRWAGAPMYLLEWQRRIVRELFGWRRADGFRLYRTCYIEAPRKSGKSTLASAIALVLAYADNEAAPQVYFAAYDRDQAAVCYSVAKHMVESSSDLFGKSQVYASNKQIVLQDNPGGVLKCLSSDSAKQYGLNLHGLIFDELMTQKTREQWDALTTAQGSREQPMTFCISTAGWDQQSICFEQHEHTREIYEGTIDDPTFFGVVFGAPMDADWTSEDVWKASNPSLGDDDQGATVKIEYYRERFKRAESLPTEQNSFRTLFLSQWVGQAERFIDMQAWDANAAPVEIGKLAFGGLDLASTTDMAAFVVVSGDDHPRSVHPYIFLPEDGIVEREHRDRAPYTTWAREGWLTLTPGATIDYSYIKQTILEAGERFDLRDISYDRWNATQLVGELEDENVLMVKLGQGFSDMSAPTKELLRLITDGKLAHGGHPVLRWCASNTAAQTDPAGNVKPNKEKSAHRIDPIVATIMALDGWNRRGRTATATSVYARRGMIVA